MEIAGIVAAVVAAASGVVAGAVTVATVEIVAIANRVVR